MRAAPAISVPLGTSAAWRCAQSLLWACATASLCAWVSAQAGQPAVWGLVALPLVGLAAWHLLPGTEATLHWDGQQWHLGAHAVRPTVALDLGRFMLLSLEPTAGGLRRQWLPATAAQAGAQWHGLRAALYSRAPESPLSAAPPPGASAPD